MKCARTVCNEVAEWKHPDAWGRLYCEDCKCLIELHNPTLRGRFTLVTDAVTDEVPDLAKALIESLHRSPKQGASG